MEHVPGPASSAVHLPGSAARALPMPRISLALSQVAPGGTLQRAALAHPGQQQRLLPPARFTSAFARPPAPRSQSPLRRLAERSAEFTASQPPFAFPLTQEDLQVRYMLSISDQHCTKAQIYARLREVPTLTADLKPCSSTASAEAAHHRTQEQPAFLSQPQPGQHAPTLASNYLAAHQRAAHAQSPPPAMFLASESQAMSAHDPGASSQRMTATPPRPGPSTGSAWGLPGTAAGGASATAAKLLDQIARMSSCEEAMERMTKRLEGIEEVCGRMEGALAGLQAAVQQHADLPRPPAVLQVSTEGTQTARMATLHVNMHSAGTQTSPRPLSDTGHGSDPARMRDATEQTQAAPIPWQRRIRARTSASREDAEQLAPAQAKRARMEAPAAPQSGARDAAAETQTVQRANRPASAACAAACAATAMPQATPWRTKASVDPFMQAPARPAEGPWAQAPSFAAEEPGRVAGMGPTKMQNFKGPAVAERPRPRLPPANMAYARLGLLQAAAEVRYFT